MKKIKNWRDVYTIPLEYDGITYAWSKNGDMALMFTNMPKEHREKCVNIINGTDDSKLDGIELDGIEFSIANVNMFCVRGWGNLTGIGGLNLPVEKAAELQNDFAKYIYDRLCK